MAVVRLIIACIAALVGIILAAPVILLWLVFEAVALLTSLGARILEPNVIAANDLVEFVPTIGWKPKPNLDAYYLTMVKDGAFHARTDAQGWPDPSNVSNSNVVVFGDSYAFGYGVDSRHAFWHQEKNISIKSIGAPGYNMVQELILMRQFSDKLRGKLVVWFIYFGNDLYDNLVPNNQRYRSPFVRKVANAKEWQITTEHVSLSSWPSNSDPKYYDRLAELSCSSYLADRAYSACEFLISEACHICSEVGARLTIMTIPDAVQLTPKGQQTLAQAAPDSATFHVDFPDKKIKEIASKFAIPMVALKDHLTAADYKERDPHWNEKGHQRVAAVIRQVWESIAKNDQLSGSDQQQNAPILEANTLR